MGPIAESLIGRLPMLDTATILWFFLGIFAGIAGSLVGIEFFAWRTRPILLSPQRDEDWLRDFEIPVSDYRSETPIVAQPVAVWRLKIANVGRLRLKTCAVPLYHESTAVQVLNSGFRGMSLRDRR
jgi:hypothetical protein